MAHDVFISYSRLDTQVADTFCDALEAHGLRCWIAPRDVAPGEDWSGAIVTALRQSRLLLVVFSSRACRSRHVVREIQLVGAGVPVLPVRIEDVQPVGAFEYFLGLPQWLDAFAPPREQHLERLVASVARLLGRPAPPVKAPVGPGSPEPVSQERSIDEMPIDGWTRRRPVGRLRRFLDDV